MFVRWMMHRFQIGGARVTKTFRFIELFFVVRGVIASQRALLVCRVAWPRGLRRNTAQILNILFVIVDNTQFLLVVIVVVGADSN